MLTDEECDLLYYEIAPPTWWAIATPEQRCAAVARIPSFLGQPMVDAFCICHPDCPISVIEGLPAMVEKWTGKRIVLTMSCEDGVWKVSWRDETGFLGDDAVSYRHLAHACLSAAFSACVVLGRRG